MAGIRGIHRTTFFHPAPIPARRDGYITSASKSFWVLASLSHPTQHLSEMEKGTFWIDRVSHSIRRQPRALPGRAHFFLGHSSVAIRIGAHEAVAELGIEFVSG